MNETMDKTTTEESKWVDVAPAADVPEGEVKTLRSTPTASPWARMIA